MNSIQDVVSSGLCISCGACVAAAQAGAAVMRESARTGMFEPMSPLAGWGRGREWEACPGRGYDIEAGARQLYAGAPHEDVELGRWVQAWACRATSDVVLENASSGGVMTALAMHLLDCGAVDGVATTRLVPGAHGPRPQTVLATTRGELLAAQGSKYCPVPALEIVPRIRAFAGRVAFVGTPCQVAGLRLIQRADADLARKIALTVANFCGGFRDFRETDRIIERAGHAPGEVAEFRYRGGGQPGSMRIRDRSGKTSELPYPDYVRVTGITKHLRCRLCVDATGEWADLACGDAWIPRFLESGQPWSVVLARTPAAAAILRTMQSRGELVLADVGIDEIRRSQAGNLASKKHRQSARRRLFGWLGQPLPDFDGGYPRSSGGLAFELKVLVSQGLLSIVERMGLYPTLARLTGRWPLPRTTRSEPH